MDCSFQYTLQDWPSRLRWTKDGADLYEEYLGYDGSISSGVSPLYSGRIAQRKDDWTYTAGVAPRYRTVGYAYDSFGRLSAERTAYGQTPSSWTETGFSYDRRGNLLECVSTSPGPLGQTSADTLSLSYSGDRLSGGYDTSTSTQYSFIHDALGRMTSDGLNGVQIQYNALKLPRKVTKNGVVLAKYSYLADGTQSQTIRQDGTGLLYRGSLTYRKGLGGAVTFEGADFSRGRIASGQVFFHVTDHLGSVVGIVRSGDSSPVEYNRYSAYGERTRTQLSQPFTPAASLRMGFAGKEDESVEFGVPYSDFGARHYSSVLSRWLTPDPLGEKYYDVSPYAYCNGDPVNRIDSDGKSHYSVNSKGIITQVNPTNDPFDILYTVDDNGLIDKFNYLRINDIGILKNLASNDYILTDYNGIGRVFTFLADNTNVEWALEGYKIGNEPRYFLTTNHSSDNVSPHGLNSRFDVSDKLFEVHSHPGKDGLVASGYNNSDISVSKKGNDKIRLNSQYNSKTRRPYTYIYHPLSSTIFRYDIYSPRITDRKLGKNNKDLKGIITMYKYLCHEN